MNRWRVGEDIGSKEMDGCPLTPCSLERNQKELTVALSTSPNVSSFDNPSLTSCIDTQQNNMVTMMASLQKTILQKLGNETTWRFYGQSLRWPPSSLGELDNNLFQGGFWAEGRQSSGSSRRGRERESRSRSSGESECKEYNQSWDTPQGYNAY
jgi:hypothetical protein